MREILFRGKGTSGFSNGKWREGYYVKDFWMPTNKGYGIIPSNQEDGGYCEVDPATVGQYTGLTDKNGNKIFEGDLLDGDKYPYINDTGEHNYFAEVVWFDNCPAFGLCIHKHPLSAVRGISEGNCDIIEDFDSSKWEVIGNIHDNPELLKGGDQK